MRDTSVALDLVPDAVAADFRNLPLQARLEPKWRRSLQHWKNSLAGYWGAPADAREGEGLKSIHGNLDDIFPKLRAVWEGSSPNLLFRSWYSVLPPNKGFFKIWILTIILFVILWGWAYFAMQGLVSNS